MELEPDRWRSFTPGSTRDRFFKLNPKRGHRDPAPWHRHPMHYCHATDRDRMARAPSSPVAFSCHLTWMPPALAGCTHRRLARDAAAAQACLHAAALRCALSTSRLTGQSRMGLLGPGPWWRHRSPTCFARRSRGRRAAVPRPLAVDVAVSHARSTTKEIRSRTDPSALCLDPKKLVKKITSDTVEYCSIFRLFMVNIVLL